MCDAGFVMLSFWRYPQDCGRRPRLVLASACKAYTLCAHSSRLFHWSLVYSLVVPLDLEEQRSDSACLWNTYWLNWIDRLRNNWTVDMTSEWLVCLCQEHVQVWERQSTDWPGWHHCGTLHCCDCTCRFASSEKIAETGGQTHYSKFHRLLT